MDPESVLSFRAAQKYLRGGAGRLLCLCLHHEWDSRFLIDLFIRGTFIHFNLTKISCMSNFLTNFFIINKPKSTLIHMSLMMFSPKKSASGLFKKSYIYSAPGCCKELQGVFIANFARCLCKHFCSTSFELGLPRPSERPRSAKSTR